MKKFIGNLSEKNSQYGQFFIGSLKFSDLKDHVDEKGYIKIVVNKLKETGKFGQTHSIAINEYKKDEKQELDELGLPKLKKAKQEEISIEDIPF